MAEEHARKVLREVITGKLAIQSSRVLDGREAGGIEVVALLALAAVASAPTGEARGMLQIALEKTAQLRWSLRGVSEVAFSPDGKTLASLGGGGKLQLWDVASHQPVGEPMSGQFYGRVVFSPDGKTLASVGEWDTLQLWDVASHQLLGKFSGGHEVTCTPSWDCGGVSIVAFSPDGKTLATADSNNATMRLWDVTLRQPLGEPLRRGSNVAFSPDGKTLAAAGPDNAVQLWNVANRQPLGEPLRGHDGRESDGVSYIAFSPEGKTLASVGRDGTVQLWDLAGRQTLGEPLRGHVGAVLSIAFSPDGNNLLSLGEDGTVRFWDVARRQALGQSLRGAEPSMSGNEKVYSVAFSPDGKTLASAGSDNMVRLWDVARRHALGAPLRAHEGPKGPDDPIPWNDYKGIWSIAFSPDGKILASAGGDGTVRLWDVADRQTVGEPLRGLRARSWASRSARMARPWPRRVGTARCDCGKLQQGSLMVSPSRELMCRTWEAI